MNLIPMGAPSPRLRPPAGPAGLEMRRIDAKVRQDFLRPAFQTPMRRLELVYALSAVGSVDRALDEVFSLFDDLFLADHWDVARTVLRVADVERLTPEVAVGLLSATFRAKGRLPERAAISQRVERLLQRVEDPAVVEQILAGLR